MSTYRCVIEYEIDASTPRMAAEHCITSLKSPDEWPTIEVIAEDGTTSYVDTLMDPIEGSG